MTFHPSQVLNKIDLPGADVDRVKREIEEVIGLDCSDALACSAKMVRCCGVQHNRRWWMCRPICIPASLEYRRNGFEAI